jgi:hypothetical protein
MVGRLTNAEIPMVSRGVKNRGPLAYRKLAVSPMTVSAVPIQKRNIHWIRSDRSRS